MEADNVKYIVRDLAGAHGAPGQPGDTKTINGGRFGVVQLTRDENHVWRSADGTAYALDDGLSTDKVNRCGVAPFALPTWPIFREINDACVPHDYAYDSWGFQFYNSRADADRMLESLEHVSGHPILGAIFHEVAHLLGAKYWENQATR